MLEVNLQSQLEIQLLLIVDFVLHNHGLGMELVEVVELKQELELLLLVKLVVLVLLLVIK